MRIPDQSTEPYPQSNGYQTRHARGHVRLSTFPIHTYPGMHKYVTSPVPPWFERSKKALGSVWLAFIWVLMEQIPAVGSNYHMYNANSMQLLFNPGNCNTKIWILSSRSNELKRRSNHLSYRKRILMLKCSINYFAFLLAIQIPSALDEKRIKGEKAKERERGRFWRMQFGCF